MIQLNVDSFLCRGMRVVWKLSQERTGPRLELCIRCTVGCWNLARLMVSPRSLTRQFSASVLLPTRCPSHGALTAARGSQPESLRDGFSRTNLNVHKVVGEGAATKSTEFSQITHVTNCCWDSAKHELRSGGIKINVIGLNYDFMTKWIMKGHQLKLTDVVNGVWLDASLSWDEY